MRERIYLKRATRTARTDAPDIAATVQEILATIEREGEDAALRYAAQFDGYDGPLILASADIAAASAQVPARLREDIAFAQDNVARVAQTQRDTLKDARIDVQPGLTVGQRIIPVDAAGAYVPGGRYAHVASAIMTVTTAKVAGCGHVVACSPPRPGIGVNPAIVHAADLGGADRILAMGGVQGVAAMAFGLFDLPPAKILVGPGNAYVAEAKRQLFGRVGIDMVAGPTDSLVLADATADPRLIAIDLVSQAEHGANSPVWLVTDDEALAYAVIAQVPALIDDLPEPNRSAAAGAWRDYAEVVLCADREGMVACSESYAPEHLTVMAADLDWWLDRLHSYGSLFLGEEVTVAYGDKATGTNHVLPTSAAASYTGGLSVHKFLRIVTWQRATPQGARRVAEATARISRLEGMEGHARAADARLARYFPGETFDLTADNREAHP
ncbi:histidinol dehydrogenase [Salipiger sp. IMCC34102]|uniref:histidinol dehydrogenase n=1 Tax=Salipiger sp. IMCC34102 TaxID=2510647 RepID=UPI00101D7A4E|nr:histidinol dehydrogenase [Salipiger sp. IMCC34102]RYH00983.1 histidinol dehydrogenase [Salipiger sp. IMCC34102]